MNDINTIKAGRRNGCGACGASESSELMQLITIQPDDSLIVNVSKQMYGEGNDIPFLLQLDNVLAESI